MPCEMLADTYVEHMRLVSKRLALDSDKVSGMAQRPAWKTPW